MARPTAVLDADLQYPAGSATWSLASLSQGCIRPCGPSASSTSASPTSRPIDRTFLAESLLRTRGLKGIAVPGAVVTDYEHLIDKIDLPDPDDRHVLAAAIAARASLVTLNVADFPRTAVRPGVSVRRPRRRGAEVVRLPAPWAWVQSEHRTLRSAPSATASVRRFRGNDAPWATDHFAHWARA